jgi:hypothetical protein
MKSMKITLLVLIATTLLCAEGFASELKGIVKTQAGEPLADVFIFYGRSMRDITQTYNGGIFSIPGQSKVIFFRRLGYHPLTKIVDSGVTNLEIVLFNSHNSEIALPKCQAGESSGKRIGDSFRLLVPEGAKSNEGFDVDYGYFSIVMRSSSRQVWLNGIYGPTATIGLPPEEWILNAIEFSERSYKDKGLFSDMRGLAKDGAYWRYVGAIGESIQYSGLTEQEAKYFDTIIDTACY